MNNERDDKKTGPQQAEHPIKEDRAKQHSSAFKETSRGDEKSTTNVEEEAGAEPERKEAMTERD